MLLNYLIISSIFSNVISCDQKYDIDHGDARDATGALITKNFPYQHPCNLSKVFQTWHLIGLQYSPQPIRSHIEETFFTKMVLRWMLLRFRVSWSNSVYANLRCIEYIMTWWSYAVICTLHYHVMQTYLMVLNCWNTCQIYSVSNVCLRLGRFSQLLFMQYMGLCGFSLPIYLMMIVRISVPDLIIIINKSELWPICHCLGLGHEQ